MSDQFWQTLRPIRKVGKLRGVIEIPTFTAACGPLNYCYNFLNSYLTAQAGIPLAAQPSLACSFECWINMTGISLVETELITFISVANPSPYTGLYVSTARKLVLKLKDSTGTTRTITSVGNISNNKWCHVAATWDGGFVSLYIDGVLDPSHVAPVITGGLYRAAGDIFRMVNAVVNKNQIYGNEFRVWNYKRTSQQIANARFAHRDITGTVDSGLLIYFPLNEGTGTSLDNEITGAPAFSVLQIGTTGWNTSFGYPYKLGGSFACGKFLLDTGGKRFSIKNPKKPYDSINFVPCIAWIDPNDSTCLTIKRYKLWNNVTGFNAPWIHVYSGQVIPDGSWIEIWNGDGNSTVNLTQVLDVETSILHIVNAADVQTKTTILNNTPTIDTSIAENFPLANPSTFEDLQVYTI